MTRIGYARVSTTDQDLSMQEDALGKAGVERVFREHASGIKADRPQFRACIDYLRQGDTLVVWRLDRAGRSVQHLVELVNTLRERGVGFRSLTESIDTTTAGGRMVFNIFASLAEFERDLITERTQAGLAAARARGRVGGRRTVMTPAKERSARALIEAETPLTEIATSLGVGRATLYRWLERERSKVAA